MLGIFLSFTTLISPVFRYKSLALFYVSPNVYMFVMAYLMVPSEAQTTQRASITRPVNNELKTAWKEEALA
jgi:hypothetical protein